MISLSHQQLSELLDGDSSAVTSREFTGVTIDSRQDCAGKLFVAIRGDNFDGHRFVDKAYSNGAVIALVEERVDCEIAQLLVDERAARGHRRRRGRPSSA